VQDKRAKLPPCNDSLQDVWLLKYNLFRRAAQALHPDREPDPERRQVKQERMRELLMARKHGDIMVMLTIYGDNVNGRDIVLAEREMTEICDALEHQLDALELEKQAYIYSRPVKHHAWREE